MNIFILFFLLFFHFIYKLKIANGMEDYQMGKFYKNLKFF